MYWTIIFLICVWGAAILALGTIDGPLVLTGQILMTVFAFAFFWSLMTPMLRQIRHYRRDKHEDRTDRA